MGPPSCRELFARVGSSEVSTGACLLPGLAAAGIPAAQLNTTVDLVDHPQLTERDRWRTVSSEVGEIRAVLPPMTFRDVELPMGPVPALGEHSYAILAELGLLDEDAPCPHVVEEAS